MLFLSSLDNIDAYIIFHKGVDNLEIEHNHGNFGVGGAVPHLNVEYV